MAVDCRELVETLRGRSDLVPKKSVGGSTGYVNVIKVGEWYQARLQIPGDGRGGEKKRKQHSLPGIFKEAEDAALYLAFITKDMLEKHGCLVVPPKLDKQHKPRTPKEAAAPPLPLQPVNTPPVTTMAVPLSMPMWQLPFAAASPLPMQPLAYVPPRF
jgi:hypothetical protein